MHYLVTGGAGFIGSHLAETLLNHGHDVTILDDLSTGKRENIPANAHLIKGDASQPSVVQKAFEGIDGCFHLAAIASVARGNEAWRRTHEVNLSATVSVFEAAKARKVPVVYASSAAVYGTCPSLPCSEASQTAPISAYGADKLACELHARAGFYVHGIPSVGLRFFNVFGPRQDPSSPYSGVISIFARSILSDAPITIYGDGEQSRDFIYVGDVVRALSMSMQALETGKLSQEVFNVCTGRATSVNAIAGLIGRLAEKQVRASYQPARAGDIRFSVGDAKKAREVLEFAAKTPLSDGMRATLDFIGEGLVAPREMAVA